MANPYERVIFELAEQKRQNAIQDRMGTIYQVWANNGEQKVRVQLGTRPDGSPWLSPWLHTEDPRGSRREEHKYHAGQNVKLSGIGGDMRQATITPWAENQTHQRPNHSTDNEHTEQYDTTRETHGRDFHEHWLINQSAQGQQSSEQPLNDGSGMTNTQMSPEQQDDVSKAITLIRHGNRPQQAARSGQPGQGPPPEGNSNPQPKILVWSKGTRGKNGPPDVNEEAHVQYGDNTKAIYNDGTIVHAVANGGSSSGANSLLGRLAHFLFGAPGSDGSSSPGDGGVGDGSDASTTTITADKIVHRVGNKTVLTLLKNNITAITGGGAGGNIMPEMLPGILGAIQSVVSQMTVPLNLPPQTQSAMAAAAYGQVVGNTLSGTTLTVDSGDLAAQVENTVEQEVGGTLPDLTVSSLASAITAALEAELASYTVANDTVPTLASGLIATIEAAAPSLDEDTVMALALGCAADAVSSAALSGLPIDLTTAFATTTENVATLQSAMQSQIGGISGAQSGMSASQLSQLASSISQMVQGLSGGSVWSLNQNNLQHRTQQDLTQKSSSNIGHTASQTVQATVGQTRMYAQADTVVGSVGQDARFVAHTQGVKMKKSGNAIFVDEDGCWSTTPIQTKTDQSIPDGTPLMG